MGFSLENFKPFIKDSEDESWPAISLDLSVVFNFSSISIFACAHVCLKYLLNILILDDHGN